MTINREEFRTVSELRLDEVPTEEDLRKIRRNFVQTKELNTREPEADEEDIRLLEDRVGRVDSEITYRRREEVKEYLNRNTEFRATLGFPEDSETLRETQANSPLEVYGPNNETFLIETLPDRYNVTGDTEGNVPPTSSGFDLEDASTLIRTTPGVQPLSDLLTPDFLIGEAYENLTGEEIDTRTRADPRDIEETVNEELEKRDISYTEAISENPREVAEVLKSAEEYDHTRSFEMKGTTYQEDPTNKNILGEL